MLFLWIAEHGLHFIVCQDYAQCGDSQPHSVTKHTDEPEVLQLEVGVKLGRPDEILQQKVHNYNYTRSTPHTRVKTTFIAGNSGRELNLWQIGEPIRKMQNIYFFLL